MSPRSILSLLLPRRLRRKPSGILPMDPREQAALDFIREERRKREALRRSAHLSSSEADRKEPK